MTFAIAIARLAAVPLAFLLCATGAQATLLLPAENNEVWLNVLVEAVGKSPFDRSDADDLRTLRERLGPAPAASDLGHALVLELATRRPEAVQWLLAQGAPCDHVEPRTGITPLMAAVAALEQGPPPMPEDSDEDIDALGAREVSWRHPPGAEERAQRNLKTVLACTKKLEARDEDGVTALLVAARHFRMDAVLQLAAAGADIDARDHDGRTAIWCAAPGEFAGLVKAHADIQAATKFGRTLLANAIVGLRGQQVLAYVRAALAAGAHDSRDRQGEWASEYGLKWPRAHDAPPEDVGRAQARALIAATQVR